MANEINFTFSFVCNNGSYRSGTLTLPNSYFDQLNPGATEGIYTATTSETTLPTGTLSSPGYLYVLNLDATNFVQMGFSAGVYGIRLLPGDFCVLRVNTAASVFVLADTANVELQYRWLEN